MISNIEGKFHYLLVRDLSVLVNGRTKHNGSTHVCPYCLYCFSEAHLLTAHLSDCSIHPEQKVEYPSPDDPEKIIKKFKAIAKTLPVPFVLYADFEAILVPAEENKESASNTKVRQLHKHSGFACLRVSLTPEFNGEIFTYSGEDSMTVFFELIRDQDHYIRSILSDVKRMKALTAEQQLQHAAATTCELCHGLFTKKNKKTKHHCYLSGLYIGPYCNTCNLKLKYKKVPTLIRLPKRRINWEKENKPSASTGHVENS